MFCHLYFAICSAVASALVLYLKEDPLRLFHDSNAGTYIWTQLILGVVFLAYFALQCLALCQAKVLDLWCARSGAGFIFMCVHVSTYRHLTPCMPAAMHPPPDTIP